MTTSIIREKIRKHASVDAVYRCLYGYYFLGIKKKTLAKNYAKAPSTITEWIQRFEKTGYVGRKKTDDPLYRKITKDQRKWVVGLFNKNPVMYQREAVNEYRKEWGEKISVSSVSRILIEAGLTWKSLERRAIQIQFLDITRFFDELSSIRWSLESLVFLDEVGFDNADMLRKHGYALKGKRLIHRGEFCRKKRISLLCFINLDGVVDCYETEGTFDRHTFVQYCRRFALDHSKVYPGTNSVWILDGASIHRDPNFITYLRSLGIVVIFLPAYCPFFNPIELIFGLLKQELKNLYEENSTENIDFFIGLALKKFRGKNLRNLFRKCGYICNGKFDPTRGLNQNLEELGFNIND